MPLPSTATLGVAVAGRTVHVCLRRRSHYAYTAEPVRGTGAEGRREALRAACRRLDAGRPRVAMAVPESRVQRHRLRLPDGLRRSEHRAVLRLHVRRALPAPASAWRYCLGDERRRPRLLAARHTDLNAARALLYESGLRPVALLTSRDALARATGTPPAPLPDTPAARLTRALAEVARCPGPDNLLHARDPNARDNGHALRTAAGAALAAGLAGVAAHAHWGSTLAPGAGDHADTDVEPPTADHGRDPQPPEEREGPAADPAPPDPPPDPADARRRAAPGWLDTLAGALPERARLTAVELGNTLRVDALAAAPECAERYLAALQEAGFEDIELEQMRRTDNGRRSLSLRAEPRPPDPAPDAAPGTPLREQLGALSRSLEARDLILEDLRRDPAGGDGRVVAQLRISGDYAALRDWLADEAAAPRQRGLDHLRLRAAEPPRLEAEVTLVLHPPKDEP
ncbi:hypothetical protein [Halorhodospira sp. 9622]|uniref:hypothetical protein n=2 Tax=Halorhodospira TaxID=85108 RepID=UPI001EE82B7C|nr:hypothetical protein [Halorhodospira sp. 9622]MCG5538160.1 hypothetical protein [Halorhodospira sp. 9622]